MTIKEGQNSDNNQMNIIIRDWQEKDFKNYRYWNNGQFKWKKFNGPYYPQKTKEEIELEIETLRKPSPEKVRKRLVIADKQTDQLIGTVSWYWQSKETNWQSIGIALYDDKYWGKGIGFDALTLWCNYLFDYFEESVRLDLRTWSGNIGMMKLAEKLGFTLEARFRKARIVDGQYYDSIGYGILREEWKNKNSETI